VYTGGSTNPPTFRSGRVAEERELKNKSSATWRSMDATITALDEVLGPFTATDAIQGSELDLAEERLRVTLSPSLRSLYKRTGRHRFHRAENVLVPPEALTFEGDYLVVYRERDESTAWGVARSAVATDNPAVDVSATSGSGTTFVREFLSLSQFLAFQAAWQAVGGALPFIGIALPSRPLAPHVVPRTQRRVSRSEAAATGDVLAATPFADVRVQRNAIAVVQDDGYFGLASRDETTFEQLMASVGLQIGDWSFLAPRDNL
jgi:hypothetical protein